MYVWDYWGPYAQHISRVELTKYANTKLFRCHLNKSKNPKIIIWKELLGIYNVNEIVSKLICSEKYYPIQLEIPATQIRKWTEGGMKNIQIAHHSERLHGGSIP